MPLDPRTLLDPALELERSSFDVDEVAARAKLDQNEASADLPPAQRARLLEALEQLAWNRYPQPEAYREIKARFAAAVGQPAERLVLTVGCDQVILATFLAAGGPGRRARIFEPTYPVYRHFARLTRTGLTQVCLGADADPSTAALGEGEAEQLLVLVNPNNPTGRLVPRPLIERALTLEPTRLVLVDEAYVDFAGPGASAVELLDAHPNLIVGRSLSKSLLAGVRLGYALAAPALIAALERLVFAPYHLNHLQLAVASCYPELADGLSDRCERVIARRQALARRLSQLGLRVWPSEANFLLFAPGSGQPAADEIHRRLLARGVRVRDASSFAELAGALRVTIGLQNENDWFIEALQACL